jgi:hypothetical protein
MPQAERSRLLSETLADWDAMHRAEGSARVIRRAIRGIPAAMWARLDEGDTTALPVAVAVSLIGITGIAVGLLERTYPLDLRRFILVTALGTLLLGAAMMRDPRQLVLRRYRLPATMLVAGFFGMAANMPSPQEWQYDAPYVETILIDRITATGFAAVGIGFAAIVVASFLSRGRLVTLIGGASVMAGTAAFGCAQIGWGFAAVTTDLAITATSIAVGLSALSFIHVVPRLRKLQMN